MYTYIYIYIYIFIYIYIYITIDIYTHIYGLTVLFVLTCLFFFWKKVEDVTTISKPQSLTSVKIKTIPWELQKKLLHDFFVRNNKCNDHLRPTEFRENRTKIGRTVETNPIPVDPSWAWRRGQFQLFNVKYGRACGRVKDARESFTVCLGVGWLWEWVGSQEVGGLEKLQWHLASIVVSCCRGNVQVEMCSRE